MKKPPYILISAEEHELLRHLASGATDARAGSILRISERTVRRRIRRLSERLGVVGRVALGVAVGQLGILAVDLDPSNQHPPPNTGP